jgi:hypothetical protein
MTEEEWRRDQALQRHEGLRRALGERFNPPLGAERTDLVIAESKLVREVANALMFVLEALVQDEWHVNPSDVTA